MNFRVLAILSAALWMSAMVLLVLGITQEGLGILMLAAGGDGLAALVFTFLAARKWVSGK